MISNAPRNLAPSILVKVKKIIYWAPIIGDDNRLPRFDCQGWEFLATLGR